MIRSAKCSLKFANKTKRDSISVFVDEYRDVCAFFVKELWGHVDTKKFIDKNITDRVDTWLSARAVQCAAKQASGIVRGTKKKQKDRIYRYNKLLEDGDITSANRLKLLINKTNMSRPSCNTVNPELDSRFVKIDDNNKTSFDIWVTLSSLGNKMKIKIPVKRHKNYNQHSLNGKLKKGIRLGKTKATFMFDLPDAEKNVDGDIVGLDMGIINTFSTSQGVSSMSDSHGHSLVTIQEKLTRKTKGSLAFKRTQEHRTAYINWSVKQLNLNNIKELRIENLKNVRKYKRTSRKLSHWTYTEIKDKIIARCEENGVRLVLRPYAYSSQRCSQCGWTQKANRNGKRFCCKHCHYVADADINASINLSLDLPEFPRSELHLRKNLIGFFYELGGRENMVSVGRKQ